MPALAQVAGLSLSAAMRRVRNALAPDAGRRVCARCVAASRAGAGAALRSLRRTARIRGQRRDAMRPMPRASAALPNRAHCRTLSHHRRGRTRQPARADSPSQVRPRSIGRAARWWNILATIAGIGRRLRRCDSGAAALAAPVVARLQPGRAAGRRSRAASRICRSIRPRCRAGASPRRRPRGITMSASRMCAARSPSRIPNASQVAAC